jgi:hypothetical protein
MIIKTAGPQNEYHKYYITTFGYDEWQNVLQNTTHSPYTEILVTIHSVGFGDAVISKKMQGLDLRELAEGLKGYGYDLTGVISIPTVAFWIIMSIFFYFSLMG